jgi:hypothetical protein
MAYKALIAVADHTDPSWRAQGLATYRFWRGLGYAIGALVAGLLAQAAGLSTAVATGGALTLASACSPPAGSPGSPRARLPSRPVDLALCGTWNHCGCCLPGRSSPDIPGAGSLPGWMAAR